MEHSDHIAQTRTCLMQLGTKPSFSNKSCIFDSLLWTTTLGGPMDMYIINTLIWF